MDVQVVVLPRKSKTKQNTLKSLANIQITGPTCDECGDRVYRIGDPMHTCKKTTK